MAVNERGDGHGAGGYESEGPAVSGAVVRPAHAAAEAQRFYERAFYDGKVLVHEPVISIPVRMVAWLD